jgi:hypothetical protein
VKGLPNEERKTRIAAARKHSTKKRKPASRKHRTEAAVARVLRKRKPASRSMWNFGAKPAPPLDASVPRGKQPFRSLAEALNKANDGMAAQAPAPKPNGSKPPVLSKKNKQQLGPTTALQWRKSDYGEATAFLGTVWQSDTMAMFTANGDMGKSMWAMGLGLAMACQPTDGFCEWMPTGNPARSSLVSMTSDHSSSTAATAASTTIKLLTEEPPQLPLSSLRPGVQKPGGIGRCPGRTDAIEGKRTQRVCQQRSD